MVRVVEVKVVGMEVVVEEQQHTHVLVQGEQERQDILLGALAANPAIVKSSPC